mmetsp:Transcript_1247/g.1899  ORF Transcript_1247/g.1899 Transcript_1247/m.1899 type:complete len:215 (-) Transcript_1247:245-889(-)
MVRDEDQIRRRFAEDNPTFCRQGTMKYPEIDRHTRQYVQAVLSKNASTKITSGMVQRRAELIAQSLDIQGFKASKGWAFSFLRRNMVQKKLKREEVIPPLTKLSALLAVSACSDRAKQLVSELQEVLETELHAQDEKMKKQKNDEKSKKKKKKTTQKGGPVAKRINLSEQPAAFDPMHSTQPDSMQVVSHHDENPLHHLAAATMPLSNDVRWGV